MVWAPDTRGTSSACLWNTQHKDVQVQGKGKTKEDLDWGCERNTEDPQHPTHPDLQTGRRQTALSPLDDRLVGLVVKAPASRAEGPGFESRLRRDFFGVESYQWLEHWHSSGYPARRLAL